MPMGEGISLKYWGLSISNLKQDLPVTPEFMNIIRRMEQTLVNDLNDIYFHVEPFKILIKFNREKIDEILRDSYKHNTGKSYIPKFKEKFFDAFDQYNNSLDLALRHHANFDAFDEKRDKEADKKKYTNKITIKEWENVKNRLKPFDIPRKYWPYKKWREIIEEISDFLVNHEMRPEVQIDKKFRKMTMRQSYSVIWYLQEVLKIIPTGDELSFLICDNCQSVFYTYDGGGLNCGNCGRNLCSDCDYECNYDHGICDKCEKKRKN